MFFPEGQIRVQMYGEPVDMRKSFDGLSALATHGMGQDPLSGQLFVFINRRATQVKVLYFDRSGFCVWAKRLEAGRFLSDWRSVRSHEMDWTALKLLLEGIEPDMPENRCPARNSPSTTHPPQQRRLHVRRSNEDCMSIRARTGAASCRCLLRFEANQVQA